MNNYTQAFELVHQIWFIVYFTKKERGKNKPIPVRFYNFSFQVIIITLEKKVETNLFWLNISSKTAQKEQEKKICKGNKSFLALTNPWTLSKSRKVVKSLSKQL